MVGSSGHLFNSVVDVLHPVRAPLADLPRAGGGATNDRLQLGFDDPDGPGWVLAGAFAAAAWGAPVVLSGDAPPDFYVPDTRTLRLARTLLGDAQFGSHACVSDSEVHAPTLFGGVHPHFSRNTRSEAGYEPRGSVVGRAR